MSEAATKADIADLKQSLDELHELIGGKAALAEGRSRSAATLFQLNQGLVEKLESFSGQTHDDLQVMKKDGKSWWWKMLLGSVCGVLASQGFSMMQGLPLVKPVAEASLNAGASLAQTPAEAPQIASWLMAPVLVIVAVVMSMVIRFVFWLIISGIAAVRPKAADGKQLTKSRPQKRGHTAGGVTSGGFSDEAYLRMAIKRMRKAGHGDVVDAVLNPST